MTLSGVVSGASGSITKTGQGILTLSGTAANTYAGVTTVSDGVLLLNKSAGTTAVPGNITISSPATSLWGTVRLGASNEIASSSVITFSPAYANSYAVFELHGNAQTLAGISDSTGLGVIENTQADTGYGNGTLTINNSSNYSYSGYLRDTSSGNGTLAIVKTGPGTLTFSGANCGSYSGGLTVSGGVLDYSGGSLPSCFYTINGGTLSIDSKTASITGFQITSGSVSGSGTLTSAATYDIQGGGVGIALAGSGIALTKSGTGTATLAGTVANTYSGVTTVSNGRLVLAKSAGVVAVPGNVTINTNTTANSYLVLGATGQIPTSAVVTFSPSASYYGYFDSTAIRRRWPAFPTAPAAA